MHTEQSTYHPTHYWYGIMLEPKEIFRSVICNACISRAQKYVYKLNVSLCTGSFRHVKHSNDGESDAWNPGFACRRVSHQDVFAQVLHITVIYNIYNS